MSKVMLKDISEVIMGQSPDGKSYNDMEEGLPLLNGAADYKGQKFHPTKYTSSPKKIAEAGDILVGVRATIGNIAISDRKYCIGRGLAAIRTKDDRVDRDYLIKIIDKEIVQLSSRSSGSTIKGIRKEDLTNIEISLPSLSEQRKISKTLNKASMLIEKRKESIGLLDEYLRSVFLDMFGDPVANSKGWKKKTIEELVINDRYAIKRGPFGGSLKKDMFVDDGYLVYEQYHALNNDFSFERYYVDEKKFEELKAFEVKAGDLIISCSGVYLGKLAEVPEGSKLGIINQALLKLTLNQNVIRNRVFMDIFTNQSFRAKYIDNKIGSGIPNFPPISEFKKFQFICPDIGIQNDYAEKVKEIELLKLKMERELLLQENLVKSLNQKYFTT